MGLHLPFLSDLFSRQLALFEDGEPAERDSIIKLLRAADVGIVDVKVEEDGRPDIPGRPVRRRQRVFFRHAAEQEEIWLPLEVESSGTIALVDLAPRITSALTKGGLLCIDELEASLHPSLALSLLRLFQDETRNIGKAQLLFTTHDTNLLGNTLGSPTLGRDQVWFTEKDNAGATHLYPLTDYHPRKHENLERGYLQGRYGAIPFLGNLSDPDS
jgi:hypothetical protein